MKNLRKLLPLLLIIAAMLLGSCSTACKSHIDIEPQDAKCDVCGARVPCDGCVDEDPMDAECDICGEAVECDKCKDDNKDGLCDVCGEVVECKVCDDSNPRDNFCDVCGEYVECIDHIDVNPANAKCDVCGGDVECAECADENHDLKCDVCGKSVVCKNHIDLDPKNAKCDICGEAVACAVCADENHNLKCDVCDADITDESAVVLFDGVNITFNLVLAKNLGSTVRTYVQKDIVTAYRNLGITAKAITEGASNDTEQEIEIIVGDVKNRGEDCYIPFYELGETGYEIRVSGSKVIINGGSEATTLAALKSFTENILRIGADEPDTVAVTSLDDIRVVQTEFDVESISFGGALIEGGSIAADTSSDYYKTVAAQLQEIIYKKAGIWLPIKELSANDAVIVLTSTERVYNDDSFTITAENGKLVVRCAFDNKLPIVMSGFIQSNFALAKEPISLSGELLRADVSFVTYEDFGAVGDGKTDDATAIRKAHEFANECGQNVFGTSGKTYYIFNTYGYYIPIRTNVDWRGASFIIDDREISPISGGKYNSLSDVPIFKVERDPNLELITADSDVRTALAAAGLNPSTTKIDLSILGVEGPVMIIPYNSGHKVFRRRSYGAWKGDSMHEVIVLDGNGNVDPETPIMFSYTKVTTLYIYPLDESSALTIQNAAFTTRVSQTNVLNASTGDTRGGYIQRGIYVNRSYTTIKNVKHYVTDELKLTDQVDENGKVIACGAIYQGFFKAQNANEVTFENCEVTGRRCYKKVAGGADGTYDITGTLVNKIVFKNCTQTNFWVKVDENYNIIPTTEDDPEAKLSMSSISINGNSLQMHWGIGGTNYCKNMEYIGSTLSRLDAHAGLYNGKIIDSTVNYISLIGCGEFYIENSRWYASGSGDGSNSLIHLRNDYGSTWNGTISIKDVEAYAYTSSDPYVVYHTYNNWYFGYTCHFPNIDIDNLELYDIKTKSAVPSGYQLALTRSSTIYAGTRRHLPISHTAPYFPTIDSDGDGKIDEPLYDRDLDGVIDGPCDLDGDGVVGNTSLDYTGASSSGQKHTDNRVNLNIVAPPEFIRVQNNKAGLVYVIACTADGVTSDGGFYDDVETFGGFYGDTKFYYSDEDYLLGSNHVGQTDTDIFKFK